MKTEVVKKLGPWTSMSSWAHETEERRVRRFGRPDSEVEQVMREEYTRPESRRLRPVGT
jgi:hypothetical protein